MATDARRLSRNRAVATAIAMVIAMAKAVVIAMAKAVVIAMAKAVVETAEPYGRLWVVRYLDSSDIQEYTFQH